jgi:hypothetical protein
MFFKIKNSEKTKIYISLMHLYYFQLFSKELKIKKLYIYRHTRGPKNKKREIKDQSDFLVA